MDEKYWFYIILGVIWFVSRFFKKPEQQKEIEGEKPSTQPFGGQKVPEQKPQAMTFEELLREITEAREPRKTAPVPASTTYVDYDDDIKEEEQSLETIQDEISQSRQSGRQYKEYEEARAMAFNRPSLEESMKLGEKEIEFGKFKAFEQEKQRDLLKEYTKSFQDPEGLKAAIVMSEILNRKF